MSHFKIVRLDRSENASAMYMLQLWKEPARSVMIPIPVHCNLSVQRLTGLDGDGATVTINCFTKRTPFPC